MSPLQVTKAWRQLVQAHQQQEDELLSHHKQFMSLVDAVECNCATIQPTAMAKKNSLHKPKPDKALKAKRDKMIAALFVEAANHGFKPMMRDMANDFALGASMHPSTIEEAMEVMTVLMDQPACKATTMKSQRERQRKKETQESPDLNFSQMDRSVMKKKGLCYHCKEPGHCTFECPKQESNEGSNDKHVVQIKEEEQVHSWMNN